MPSLSKTYTLNTRNNFITHLGLCIYSLKWTLIAMKLTVGWKQVYRGADKSLARPRRKQAAFPAFCGTWRFITTFTRVHHLSPTLAKSVYSSVHHTFDRRSLFPSWLG